MPERSLLKLLPAAVCLVIFLAVLLIARSFFRRATRGETVQATVRRVEMDGSIPDIHPDVTIQFPQPKEINGLFAFLLHFADKTVVDFNLLGAGVAFTFHRFMDDDLLDQGI